MRSIKIDKDGFRYTWTIRGLNETACAADIEANQRTAQTDYVAAMFAERYGCIAEVQKLRLMSHNQYQAFLENNAKRMRFDESYTFDDYTRDAASVEVLPFRLEQFGLDEPSLSLINKRFSSIGYTNGGDACLQGRAHSSVSVRYLAEELGCELVCNQGFSGFYKNDKRGLILEFSDCDLLLVVCKTQRNYAAQLAELNDFYEVDGRDICLEVFFDNIHMDNIFLPRENVSVAISSVLQRGFDGYDETVKKSWRELYKRDKVPIIGFRVVEAPIMVQDLEYSDAEVPADFGISHLLANAESRCAHTAGRDNVDFGFGLD